MESRLLAQNKSALPRPQSRSEQNPPGAAPPARQHDRVSFGLDGGDAGLFEGPAAGGADSLGGVALMFIFRQKAVANFRLAVFGQALEAEVATQSPESFW